MMTGRRDRLERRALLVAGMHRSGTSAVARSLSFLGAALPRTPLSPGKGDEVHWGESAPIEALHEELLASAGTRWDDPSPLPPSWYDSPAGCDILARLVEVAANEYADAKLFVVKDPRICRFVPLWIAALEQLGVEPAFVIPVRNPLEVAASLSRRDQFPHAKGVLLWLRHVLDAERDSRGHPRAFVSYADMIREPETATATICDRLSLEDFGDRAAAQVKDFLSADERHHSFTAEELDTRQEVAEWAKEAYALLLDACGSGDAPDADALDRLSGALSDAQLTYGAALAEAERRTAELRDQLKDQLKDLRGLEHRHKRTVADLNTTKDNLRSTRERLANEEKALAESRRQLSAAHRRELTWARAAREIERSRTWRLGNFLIRPLRLLTLRRPAASQGPGELAARIESGDSPDDPAASGGRDAATGQMSE